MTTPAAQGLLDTLTERIERNRRALATDDEQSTFNRLTWRVWVDATEQALREVEAALPEIERQAGEAVPIGL